MNTLFMAAVDIWQWLVIIALALTGIILNSRINMLQRRVEALESRWR